MKSRFFLVSSLAVAAIVSVGAQDASAQERQPPKERGSRWTFAPNIYRVEQPRLPAGYDAPATVKTGAMPQSSNFLGLDPAMLASRPAPVAQVAARPAMPSVSAKAFVPNTSFMPSFGQPVLPLSAGQPIQMANLPVPVTPGPHMSAPAVHTAPVHRQATRSHHGVSGKLLTPTKRNGQSASPAVAAYSSGYVPGGYLPTHSGSNTQINTAVSGRIMNQNRH